MVWMLNPHDLNYADHGVAEIAVAGQSRLTPIVTAAFVRSAAAVPNIIAVKPPQSDLRALSQQSAFTLHGSTEPLEVHRSAATLLRSFRIPADAKYRLVQELFALGIRRSWLFPDLDNLAADIRGMRFSEHSVMQEARAN